MIQQKDGIRLIGVIAGAVASAVLLCGCSQSQSSTAATKAVADTPAQSTNMQEVVITASRQSTPPKG
jgi:hypothetical protein